MTRDVESKFNRVLKKQKLDDLSQYFHPEFFDEIPFYSRLADVAFLRSLDREKGNSILLDLCLRFLDALVRNSVPASTFLAAVTVTDFEESDLLVPSLFVCHGVEQHLESRLILREPGTVFTKRIRRIVENLGGPERHQVLEDRVSVADTVKAFVGPKLLPHPQMVGIDYFKTRTMRAGLR